MIATLVTTHRSWEKADCERYAGQQIAMMGRFDRLGRQRCLVLTGEMTGSYRWFADDEIAKSDLALMPKTPEISGEMVKLW